MATFVHKTTLAYLPSQEPTELPEPIGNYLENPDMSAVGTGVGTGPDGFIATVRSQYWKADVPGNAVLEMTAGEKAVVDAAELLVYKAAKLDALRTAAMQKAAEANDDYKTAKAAVEAAKDKAAVDAVEIG